MACLLIKQPTSTRCKSWRLTLGREVYRIQLSLPLWIEKEEWEVFIFLQFCSPKCEIIELVMFFFPMWEKVIQAVNSGVSLSEDSAFVNTCSLDLFQDQPDRSSRPCQCARLPVTKPYFFQYLCFYQRIYFSKPVLRWDSLSCLFYPRTSVEDYCRSVCVPMIQPSTLLRQKTVLAKI